MNSKVVQNRGTPPASVSAGEAAKYLVAVLLVAAGVFAFYWFADEWAPALRGLLVAVGVIAGLAIFATSRRGAQTREFLAESRFELRKVVWPSREEALRTTWVVMLAVLIISLLLSGFDLVIRWLVKLLLGS